VFVDFFIRRPVLSAVLAMLTVIAGALAIPSLPIARYPTLAAPQIVVNSVYIGASSQVVEAAVTTPLEVAINGAEGMRYIQSSSTNDGLSTITVTFEPGRNIDLAAVDVQNRVQSALPRVPVDVRNTGVTVTKSSTSIVLAIAFYADRGPTRRRSSRATSTATCATCCSGCPAWGRPGSSTRGPMRCGCGSTPTSSRPAS
jgi:HAE1 family hydrophobic/amphiphilic exporter-1